MYQVRDGSVFSYAHGQIDAATVRRTLRATAQSLELDGDLARLFGQASPGITGQPGNFCTDAGVNLWIKV